MAAGCQEDASEARWVAQGCRAERGSAEVVQPRPEEVAGVSAAVLRRAASASRGLAAAPRCCPARAGHLRLRRARRSAQRRRRTEGVPRSAAMRSEEHTSELQSHSDLVCRLLLEKKKKHT